LVKRAVVGRLLFLELLSGVHFGQGLHPGEGPSREELGGDQILSGRCSAMGFGVTSPATGLIYHRVIIG
jgi:hypothetical protein